MVAGAFAGSAASGAVATVSVDFAGSGAAGSAIADFITGGTSTDITATASVFKASSPDNASSARKLLTP